MKRAKMMLLAIAVLATVGGALAFKAQKLGSTKYCYLTTDSQPNKIDCTLKITASARPALPGEIIAFFTSTTDQSKCGQLDCPQSGIIDQQ